MKKLIVVSLALAAASTMYAQGTVKFATTGGRASFATVAEGQDIIKVGDYLGTGMIGAVIYEGKEIGRADFAVSSKGAATGRLAGDTAAVEGLAEATEYSFTLQAFNAAYEAADKSQLTLGGTDGLYFGESAAYTYTTGKPSDPTALPAAAMKVENFGVNAYSVVPEPTTIALGILGLSSLLLLRRRD